MSKKKKYKGKKFKIFSWKALDKRFRIKRKVRLLGIALLVFVATAGTYAALYLFQTFKKPFVRADSGPEVSFSWLGEEPKTFAWLVSSGPEHKILTEAAVLHIDPQRERVVVVEIPAEGFSLSHGVSACLSTLSRKLAVPINGYFLIEEAALNKLRVKDGSVADWKDWGLGTILQLPAFLKTGRGHFWSNLSLPEILRVSKFILTAREDQRIELELERGEDPADVIESLFTDRRLEAEGARVLILNGTEVSGLAARAREWLENLGCFVLDIGNAPQKGHEESLLLARDPESYTVRRLARGLQFGIVKELDSSLDWARRADIVLILGVDKAGFF